MRVQKSDLIFTFLKELDQFHIFINKIQKCLFIDENIKIKQEESRGPKKILPFLQVERAVL